MPLSPSIKEVIKYQTGTHGQGRMGLMLIPVATVGFVTVTCLLLGVKKLARMRKDVEGTHNKCEAQINPQRFF